MSKLGIRKRVLLQMNDLLVSRTPAQLPRPERQAG
jgi:hypothetical protein